MRSSTKSFNRLACTEAFSMSTVSDERMGEHALTIRPIEEDELALMVDVWHKAGLPCRPRGRDSPEELRRQHRDDPEGFLGAFVEGRMVGVVIASDDGRKGWINRLAVLPEARRRGVAKALVTAAEGVLRKRGRKLFAVLIEDYNDASMRLFRSLGYAREDKIIYFAKREDPSY